MPASHQTVELLRELTLAFGVAGHEAEVRSILRKHLQEVASIEQDRLGSIVFHRKGGPDRPRVMLPAHMDEIGFMVKLIDEKGFLRFAPLGGWFDQNILSQRVVIRTAKGDVPGVVGCKPPHLIDPKERDKVIKIDEMFIDIGARGIKEAQRLGVRPGDPIMPLGEFTPMKGRDAVLAKALDDRVGCAILVETLRRLGSAKLPCSVYAVGTVQEELGLRGARTSAHVVDPDVCVVVDVGIPGDTPGVKPEEATGELGKGPAIHLSDGGMLPNLRLRDLVIEVAEKHNIPYQLTLLQRGATDGGAIHLHSRGVPTVFIAVLTRYIHSHSGIINLADLDTAVRLLLALLPRLDQRTVESLTA